MPNKPGRRLGNMPDHNFGESGKDKQGHALGQNKWDPNSPSNRNRPPQPDDICYATLITATVESDGFEMVAQCGHKRSEH